MFSAGTASAERRVALVMGDDDYRTVRKLDNAVNDARTLEETLKKLGFDVYFEPDRDLRRMRRALDDFREDARNADVVLVFFAGHGVEIDGENRLLPVDADASSLKALEASTLPLEEVRATVSAVSKVGLIILDACRNDPFGATDGSGRGVVALAGDKDVKPGLGRIGRAENTLFAFSAAPGETASDGADGHSPFTAALAKYLGTDGLEIRSVLTLVQQEVYDLSRGKQLPYVESGLPNLFFASATSQQLPERERLLLAMADVTPDIRAEVEQIASDADMPLAPLYGALIGSDAGKLSDSERMAKLHQAADAFVKVREELKTLSSTDPEVTHLRTEADQQLSLGAFEAARAKLAAAAEIDSRSRQVLKTNYVERTLSEAATHAISGGAANAELAYAIAIAEFEKAVALYGEAGDELEPEHADRRLAALSTLGGLYTTTGDVARAKQTYETLGGFAEQRAAGAPSDPRITRDLAVVRTKIGNSQRANGDLSGALDSYRAALVLLEKITGTAKPNEMWLSDLAVTNDDIGNVLLSQGELSGAIDAFKASFEIKQQLVTAAPGDAVRLRDLTIVYDELGDVQHIRGNSEEALIAYRASLEIRQELGKWSPDSINAQRDISVSHDKIGDVLRDGAELDAALASYGDGRKIIEKLVKRDPVDTQLRRDLSVSSGKIGNVLREQGNLDAALAAYRDSLATISAMAASDPANTDWQRDLSVGLEKIADVLYKQGDLDGALDGYEKSLPIVRKLVASDQTNTDWQRDLSITLAEIGNLRLQKHDFNGAGQAFYDSLQIREALASSQPDNALWQRDLVIAYIDFARVADNPKEVLTRALDITLELQQSGRLPAKYDYMPGALRKMIAKLGAQ